MQQDAFLIEKERLLPWLEELQQEFRLIGPAGEERLTAFSEVESVKDIRTDYLPTMLGPRKFIFHPVEKICTIRKKGRDFEIETLQNVPGQILFGVRSCDLHAIHILDTVFLKNQVVDRTYRLRRENTVIMGLHCSRVSPGCFCASMGTGPFFEPKEGYDFLFTDLGTVYLAETLGERALNLISPLKPLRAGKSDFDKKEEIGRRLKGQFHKKFDTTNMADIIFRNQDHPVWQRTADERCLGCTNCTMVCPTCFCYDIRDEISFDLATCERYRRWDSCQELHFAEVHGGNFRPTRMARLRQFVTHKLCTWVEQMGCFGCVGCGRCMTWCPTKIDLTEMAGEITATGK